MFLKIVIILHGDTAFLLRATKEDICKNKIFSIYI